LQDFVLKEYKSAKTLLVDGKFSVNLRSKVLVPLTH